MIAKTNFFSYYLVVFVFAIVSANFRKRGRRGNSFPPVPLSFPRRPSGLGFCETPSGVSLKESSSFVVNILQHKTFCKFADHFGGGAKHRPRIFPRQILSARRAKARLAVGQDEVRLPCDSNSVSFLLCPKIIN